MKKLSLKLLSLSLILPAGIIADTKVTFTLPSGMAVEIIEAPFKKELFKVEGCRDQEQLCLINNSIPFGIAFGMPKTYIKNIKVSFQGRSYSLNTKDMYNAWGSRPLEQKGIVRYFGGKCYDTKNCLFRGLFSDAGGTFVAEWQIKNGKSIRTILTDSNDVINLITKNIDSPNQ